MRRPRPLLVVLVLTALTVVGTGCGVDAGDQGALDRSGADGSAATTTTTTATTPLEDLTPEEEAAVQRSKDLYVEMGMDPKSAECLARGLVKGGALGGEFDLSDTGAMMDVINQCDIDIADLNGLASDNGISSMEEGLAFGIRSSLEAGGLTSDEADCVASAYIDEFGTDMTAMQDRDKIAPLLEGCDVDPSALGN